VFHKLKEAHDAYGDGGIPVSIDGKWKMEANGWVIQPMWITTRCVSCSLASLVPHWSEQGGGSARLLERGGSVYCAGGRGESVPYWREDGVCTMLERGGSALH
jgi:hypothetical protein